MKPMRALKTTALLGGILLILASCASTPEAKNEAPDWVTLGSGAFKDSGSRVFYGVGAASGIRNKSLLKTAAQNRARAEIAKTFKIYVSSLMESYTVSVSKEGGGNTASTASEEQFFQHIEQTIKTSSSGTLTGARIIKYWVDPSNGTLYALARLDLGLFKNNLEKMEAHNSEIKNFAQKNAEKSFDHLAEEAEKN